MQNKFIEDLHLTGTASMFDSPVTAVNHDRAIAFRILELSGEFLPNSLQNNLLDQQRLFNSKGWKIIQIFEDELINCREIVLSRCRHAMRATPRSIYARRCKIGGITPSEARVFFNAHHIQGCGRGASIFAGLFYNSELVSCIALGKARFNPSARYELIRFASLLNTSVIGAASRLIGYARKYLLESGSIVSYADKRYGSGEVYLLSGFRRVSVSAPCYWYYKSSDRSKKYHRSSFQKHKLSAKLQVFDAAKTELVNMQLNGWSRIYDAGNDVYILE